jgi:predicted DCC family thiol-disulfide oxidoreductase YuxK
MNNLPKNCLIYDGECPLCKRYSHYVMLKDMLKDLRLVNARTDKKLVKFLRKKGMDLDKGIILKTGDTLYYGADAMHQISVLLGEKDSGWHRFLFLDAGKSQRVYPLLATGRRALLTLLGRPKL